jgi:hypothetical protein
LGGLEIAICARNYVQQLIKMITFASVIGFDEPRLTIWCTLLQERYNLQLSSINIGDIVTAALTIDGKNLAVDINSPALMQKAGLIALINSRHWNHQVILDVLDNVCTPRNHFLDLIVHIQLLASRSLCHIQ